MGVAKLPRGTNHSFASIPAVYRGHKMRSRLEVRWAVFFDELGVAWEYEPRTFRTPQGGYLPDFHVLTRTPFWLEIKGPEPVERDYVRAGHVQKQTGEKLRFFVGSLPAAPSHGILRTRVLSGRAWRPADWCTPWGALRLDAALTAGNVYRFDDGSLFG